MRGFEAMCLLRKSRRVFLAPQCAALRCPWMSALLVPAVRVPSSLLVPVVRLVCVFFLLHMYNKSVLQYCRYIKTTTTNPRGQQKSNGPVLGVFFWNLLRSGRPTTGGGGRVVSESLLRALPWPQKVVNVTLEDHKIEMKYCDSARRC